MQNKENKLSVRQKINNKIDNSIFAHWALALACLYLGATTFWGSNYASTAFFIGAGALLLPPMRKNINAFVGNEIPPKYFMNFGLVLCFIAMFIFSRTR